MAKKESFAARTIRQLGNVEEIEAGLNLNTFATRIQGLRRRREAGLESAAEAARLEPPVSQERLAQVLEAAKSGLRKLAKHGAAAPLTPPEEIGLEAIVLLEGRPALLVRNGRFEEPPPKWNVLGEQRPAIEGTFASVGRIEVTGHPELDWIGTGFLVADEVVMTNRHVAKEFSRESGKKWVFELGMKPRIDFLEEFQNNASAEVEIKSVVGIHEKYDLALLRVANKGVSGAVVPKPLALDPKPTLQKQKKVYVVGYPAFDTRNALQPMSEIFKDIYNVKRLQPGEMTELAPQQGLFTHDCSTLGGNSGSCVIDLETRKVVGLHFSGRYREANFAILLSGLVKDPLFKKGKVNFA